MVRGSWEFARYDYFQGDRQPLLCQVYDTDHPMGGSAITAAALSVASADLFYLKEDLSDIEKNISMAPEKNTDYEKRLDGTRKNG